MLEDEFFRNRTADFFYMFLIGGTLMSILAYFVNLLFLGHAFTIMLVYIWSRRNPAVRMNLFGLMTFQAPYLPWVLLGFSILLGSSTVVDIIGIVVGHFYYFFEDVFPNEPHGFRVLETPRFIKLFFDWLITEDLPIPDDDRPERFEFNLNRPTHEAAGPGEAGAQDNARFNDSSAQASGSGNSDEGSESSSVSQGERREDRNELRARNVNQQQAAEID